MTAASKSNSHRTQTALTLASLCFVATSFFASVTGVPLKLPYLEESWLKWWKPATSKWCCHMLYLITSDAYLATAMGGYNLNSGMGSSFVCFVSDVSWNRNTSTKGAWKAMLHWHPQQTIRWINSVVTMRQKLQQKHTRKPVPGYL